MGQFVAEQCPQCGAPLPPGGARRICAYCGSSLVRQDTPSAGGPSGGWGVHLRSVICIDQQGLGIEAFRLLIPADWKFIGGVHWTMNNPGMPAVIAFRAFNPHGGEALEVFPNIACFWSTDPMMQMNIPVGGLYMGNEVRPPAHILQVLRELVIPRYRGRYNPTVTAQEHLPDLPGLVRTNASAGPVEANGGRVRIRYHDAEQEIEEDIFGVIELNRIVMPGMFGVTEMIYWWADYLFSFRAAAGNLDHLNDLFMGLVRSFRLNPDWYARYLYVSQMMIQNQIQHIHQIGQVSRMISQTGQEINQMMMDSFYRRQETLDRLADRFSESIRGVDTYHDPFSGHQVELPGGYRYAWATPLGEYIVTDDPNFNPNIGSNATWELIQRQE